MIAMELKLVEPALLRQEAYIGGKWVSAAQRIDVFDPSGGGLVGQAPDLGEGETTAAISAASAAFEGWRAISAKERSGVLRRWYELMMVNQEDLAQILTAEQGKPLAEARGEVAYAASFLEWFSEEAKRVDGHVLTPHAVNRRLVVQRRPVGVVAAVTPWNFPLAMITRKVGPALAVGCTMVLKPSELTPLSALALAHLAEAAGVPPGVFNVVTGQASPIGDALTGDARVRKLTFTGSTRVGKMLAAKCAATVKRVSLELGGNAPFLVFDDADVDAAVEGAIASKFRNAGQTCVCANRLLVQSGIYDAFARHLAAAVDRMVVGSGREQGTEQGPLINAQAVEKAASHVEDAVRRGGRVITSARAVPALGTFHAPTVIVDVPPDALLCREETFGPVAGLIRFKDEADAVAMANDTDAGLAAYVYTRDLDRGWRITEALDYGMVGLNTGMISTEMAPFGGIKESGMGREGSHLGLDDYLDVRLTCVGLSAPSNPKRA